MEEELTMLEVLRRGSPLDHLDTVVTAEELLAAQQAVRGVRVDNKLRQYLVQIVQATRDNEELVLGASPRASIALFRTAQAMAAIRGRTYVLPDDVKRVTTAVLTHRGILKPESRLRKVTAVHVVNEIVADVPVPILSEGQTGA